MASAEELVVPLSRTMTCPKCGHRSAVDGRIAEFCASCGFRICRVLFDGFVFVVKEQGKEKTIVVPTPK